MPLPRPFLPIEGARIQHPVQDQVRRSVREVASESARRLVNAVAFSTKSLLTNDFTEILFSDRKPQFYEGGHFLPKRYSWRWRVRE